MSKCWGKSNLQIGDSLRLPREVFVNSTERCISSTFVGETESGIMVRNEFQPGFGSMDRNSWCYNIFITWAAIYCGAVKVFDKNNEPIRATYVDTTYRVEN